MSVRESDTWLAKMQPTQLITSPPPGALLPDLCLPSLEQGGPMEGLQDVQATANVPEVS